MTHYPVLYKSQQNKFYEPCIKQETVMSTMQISSIQNIVNNNCPLASKDIHYFHAITLKVYI